MSSTWRFAHDTPQQHKQAELQLLLRKFVLPLPEVPQSRLVHGPEDSKTSGGMKGGVSGKYEQTSYSCLSSPKFAPFSSFKPGATTYRDQDALKQNKTTYRQLLQTLSNFADESYKHQESQVAQDKRLLRFYRTRRRGNLQNGGTKYIHDPT
jgi:hypothetical protein